ncbi:2-C-methyl-D-erythritol 4-phosphate cytidylyltransferase [Nocardioides sp.]|uniref:2-C-methyl-D-erythritol 4-phosphate cytidylyltransferase n=1 Tax=Nocardioides sp. TaxID=35761 RepID=UPI00356626F2
MTLGLVLDQDRGSLPYALIHGEPLVACAAWALGEAEILPLDIGTQWSSIVVGAEPLVLHDALCPLVPPEFLASCVEQAAAGSVVVGVRPVTDTIKRIEGGKIGATLDRSDLWQVASPVVLPVEVVAALDDYPGTDLAALVEQLAARFAVTLVEAPATARRITSVEDLRVLEAMTAPGR